MPTTLSPLRYPGGKTSLARFLKDVILTNRLTGITYAEPYAGGAGAALELIFSETVDRIIINDKDPHIYAFWASVLSWKKRLVELIVSTPVTIDSWHEQRHIYLNYKRYSRLKVGFATFFLNRCNRSGILMNAGPIGGKTQSGKWKLDARYKKDELVKRIESIHRYRDRIAVYNFDALEFLNKIHANLLSTELFLYLDPPYYVRGKELYLNHYQHEDHTKLASFVNNLKAPWILTYDNTPEIRDLYRSYEIVMFNLNYSANAKRTGEELMIFDRNLLSHFPCENIKIAG